MYTPGKFPDYYIPERSVDFKRRDCAEFLSRKTKKKKEKNNDIADVDSMY